MSMSIPTPRLGIAKKSNLTEMPAEIKCVKPKPQLGYMISICSPSQHLSKITTDKQKHFLFLALLLLLSKLGMLNRVWSK